MVPSLQELRSAFSNKLLLLFSIFWLYDMDNKVKHLFLEKRVKELMKQVLLQTDADLDQRNTNARRYVEIGIGLSIGGGPLLSQLVGIYN